MCFYITHILVLNLSLKCAILDAGLHPLYLALCSCVCPSPSHMRCLHIHRFIHLCIECCGPTVVALSLSASLSNPVYQLSTQSWHIAAALVKLEVERQGCVGSAQILPHLNTRDCASEVLVLVKGSWNQFGIPRGDCIFH